MLRAPRSPEWVPALATVVSEVRRLTEDARRRVASMDPADREFATEAGDLAALHAECLVFADALAAARARFGMSP